MELISIAKILNFHGLKGEAKVGFSKGKEEQIKTLKQVVCENKTLDIQSVRLHKGFAIIKFEQINSIDELLPLKGKNLYMDKSLAKEHLEKDEYLISDLVGLKAFDNEDEFLGIVASVGTNIGGATGGGTDILCIKNDEREILVPFAKEIVPIVDLKGGKIIIKPIEGLL